MFPKYSWFQAGNTSATIGYLHPDKSVTFVHYSGNLLNGDESLYILKNYYKIPELALLFVSHGDIEYIDTMIGLPHDGMERINTDMVERGAGCMFLDRDFGDTELRSQKASHIDAPEILSSDGIIVLYHEEFQVWILAYPTFHLDGTVEVTDPYSALTWTELA